MQDHIRTRFAPSPTGYMHIGNLRTALYAYLIAKKHNGKFILRIEDTDQERLVEGSVEIIYKSLKLAELQHDEGPDIGGNFGPYTQSERKDIYIEYAKKLIDNGNAYYCFCNKERLSKLKEAQEAQGAIYKYDRFCMNLTQDEIAKRFEKNQPFVVRQKMPNKGTTSFDDTVYGKITIENNQLDDQILIKSDGFATYNFANVIDDHLMEITHVVRGNEYLSSTPKYNLLYKAFGWDIPTYVHLPLILRSSGQKLSKRAGDPSFEDLISLGYLPDTIINYVALLGWSPGTTKEIFSRDELTDLFSIEGIGKAPAIFDINKLNWMNGEYIRGMSLDVFHELVKPFFKGTILNENLDLKKISKVLQTRTEILSTIPKDIDFFDNLLEYDSSLYNHKKMKTDKEISLKSLQAALNVLNELKEWNTDLIHKVLITLAKDIGVKNSQLLWPIRIAITGKAITPGGAIEIADILGKDETIRRINLGIEKLLS
jgi:glutamyl-tRNA synthetase